MDESNELPLIQNGLWTFKGLQNKSKLLVDLSETVDGMALCMFTVAISGGGCGQLKKYCLQEHFEIICSFLETANCVLSLVLHVFLNVLLTRTKRWKLVYLLEYILMEDLNV